MPDDGQPDLAGYASVEDLVKAYRSSGDEAKRLKAERDSLAAQRAQWTVQQTQQAASEPADRLSEFGIPVDALERYVQQRVDQRVSAAFEPITRGLGARNSILSQYPDYSKYEADVARYLETDSHTQERYQRLFQVDPEGAMEFAFLKFGEAKRKETPGNGNGNPTPQRQARAEAQIPSARSGDARNQQQNGAGDLVDRAWEHYQKTGDSKAYAKARLRQVVSEDFLNR